MKKMIDLEYCDLECSDGCCEIKMSDAGVLFSMGSKFLLRSEFLGLCMKISEVTYYKSFILIYGLLGGGEIRINIIGMLIQRNP